MAVYDKIAASVEGLAGQLSELTASIGVWVAKWRSTLPPNWDLDAISITNRRFFEVAQTDEIPIAWVPRSEIVAELFAAESRDSRMEIRLRNDAAVIQDCEGILEECLQPSLDDIHRLAWADILAYKEGHFAAAQALGVLLAESLILDHIRGDRAKGAYARAREEAHVDGRVLLIEFREAIATAPIGPFFEPISLGSGKPPPEWPNRHGAVHFPTLAQFSHANALVVIMLVASLAREVEKRANSN
jgi:hypothetical protein